MGKGANKLVSPSPVKWDGARGSCCLLVPSVLRPVAARAELWVRGHLGVQEVPGEPQTSFAFGEINPDAENTGNGRLAAWESANPCLKEAFCDIFITPAHGRGDAGEVRTSLQESSGHSCCSDHAGICSVTRGWKWSLEFVVREPQCRESWVKESHAVSCSEWSLWCLCWFNPCPA